MLEWCKEKTHAVSFCPVLPIFLTLSCYAASTGCQQCLASVTGAELELLPSPGLFFHSYLPNGNFLFNILAPLSKCW